MNHCRRCDSDYEKPGTCNCFAEKPPPQAAPVFVPWVQPVPWWSWPITTTTSSPCSVCGKYDCTETHVTYWNGTGWSSLNVGVNS